MCVQGPYGPAAPPQMPRLFTPQQRPDPGAPRPSLRPVYPQHPATAPGTAQSKNTHQPLKHVYPQHPATAPGTAQSKNTPAAQTRLHTTPCHRSGYRSVKEHTSRSNTSTHNTLPPLRVPLSQRTHQPLKHVYPQHPATAPGTAQSKNTPAAQTRLPTTPCHRSGYRSVKEHTSRSNTDAHTTA